MPLAGVVRLFLGPSPPPSYTYIGGGCSVTFVICSSFSIRVFGRLEIVGRHDEHDASVTIIRQRRLHGHLRRHQDQFLERRSAIFME